MSLTACAVSQPRTRYHRYFRHAHLRDSRPHPDPHRGAADHYLPDSTRTRRGRICLRRPAHSRRHPALRDGLQHEATGHLCGARAEYGRLRPDDRGRPRRAAGVEPGGRTLSLFDCPAIVRRHRRPGRRRVVCVALGLSFRNGDRLTRNPVCCPLRIGRSLRSAASGKLEPSRHPLLGRIPARPGFSDEAAWRALRDVRRPLSGLVEPVTPRRASAPDRNTRRGLPAAVRHHLPDRVARRRLRALLVLDLHLCPGLRDGARPAQRLAELQLHLRRRLRGRPSSIHPRFHRPPDPVDAQGSNRSRASTARLCSRARSSR